MTVAFCFCAREAGCLWLSLVVFGLFFKPKTAKSGPDWWENASFL
jgi:hypothetical protein